MQTTIIPEQPPMHIQTENVSLEELLNRTLSENHQLRQLVNFQAQQIDFFANKMAELEEANQMLKDEIAILKGQKPKPKIEPSKLDKPEGQGGQGKKGRTAGKPGQPKGKPRKKKTQLQFHEKTIVQPENIPEGAEFKGFKRYAVQDIIFQLHNTQYLLARYELPDGSYIQGTLPEHIKGHYGPQLISHVLYQYHANRVPEELLYKELCAYGVMISEGQVNNILIKNKEIFRAEAEELLKAGVEAENQLQADDTGGRHKGKNQYTTIIGNRWFSLFATTDSKSRVNFFKLLQGGKNEYLINEDTIDYLREMVDPNSYLIGYLAFFKDSEFMSLAAWEQFLNERNIIKENERRFVTEAALYASTIRHGIPRNLGLHTDDAAQFNVFHHSLCWIHEERHYRKLIMTTDQSRIDLERVRDQIWEFYKGLKAYKENPNETARKELENRFDEIFQQKTSSPTLNEQLKKTHEKEQELLLVLSRPKTPLHNNNCETDARAAKIKLKISGGTRSDLGQVVRDCFLSLKQTCLKLGISFMAYIQDRIGAHFKIPRLSEEIRRRAALASSGPPC